MKKIPVLLPLLIVAFSCVSSLRAAQSEALQDAKPYLGWIPMQPAAPGEKLEIDMRRFFYPGAKNPLTLHTPPAEPGRFEAGYDSDKFLLTVTLDKNAKGLVEIPLRAGEGDDALTAVLLVGVQNPTGHTFRFQRRRVLRPKSISPGNSMDGTRDRTR